MVTTIKFHDWEIGPGKPCFIIAEVGVNHNGRIELAKKLVDAAVQAGADAVKFQTFKAEKLITAQAPAIMKQILASAFASAFPMI